MSRSSCTALLLASAIFATACGGGGATGKRLTAPPARGFSVQALADNAVAAAVTFDGTGFASARVFYRGPGEPRRATPVQLVAPGSNTVRVLGLRADTTYDLELHLVQHGGNELISVLRHRTGQLPRFLRESVRLLWTGQASPGYLATAVISSDPAADVVFAFDEAGEVRWYLPVAALGTYAGPLANGNHAAFIGESTGYQSTHGYFLEIAPGGDVVARYQAPAPCYTDNHELLLLGDGADRTAFLFGYVHRPTDLRRYGGLANAAVAGHSLCALDAGSEQQVLFDAWDHFALDEWIEEPGSDRRAAEIDFDHPNSLVVDPRDGNFVVSWRNIAQVTKIDARTGQLLWRFGGVRSQFQVVGDAFGGFSAQHTASILPDGNLLLFDNGNRHRPPQSRAVEYHLDLVRMRATLVWEYRHAPPLYTPFTGSTQRLTNGNTLVGFALAGVAVEADADGLPQWQAAVVVDGRSAPLYRFAKLGSLYEWRAP